MYILESTTINCAKVMSTQPIVNQLFFALAIVFQVKET